MLSNSDELRRFKAFAQLEPTDLDSIARIASLQEFAPGEELTGEGGVADLLYLFLTGRAAVKVRSPQGHTVLTDELGPGELLGWSAVVEPHVYVASAQTVEPTEAIVIPGGELRELCATNKDLGYLVVKGIGEVMSRRFGHAFGGHDTDELRRFKIFAELDPADLDAIARISHVQRYEAGERLTTEGATADRLYLFLGGRAAVRARSPEGRDIVIDETGPGDLLGWSAAMAPYVYTASAWTTEPSEVIVVPGDRLRRLCESNSHIGYHVVRGIGEVISRRFGQAIGEQGAVREKDLRALGGEERVIWDNGEMQLTTEAVLIGMGGDSPDVIPLDAVLDVEVQNDRLLLHVHGGDAWSPSLENPEHVAALVRDELQRARYAPRRRDR